MQLNACLPLGHGYDATEWGVLHCYTNVGVPMQIQSTGTLWSPSFVDKRMDLGNVL
jgi:hypothetical protein